MACALFIHGTFLGASSATGRRGARTRRAAAALAYRQPALHGDARVLRSRIQSQLLYAAAVALHGLREALHLCDLRFRESTAVGHRLTQCPHAGGGGSSDRALAKSE